MLQADDVVQSPEEVEEQNEEGTQEYKDLRIEEESKLQYLDEIPQDNLALAEY